MRGPFDCCCRSVAVVIMVVVVTRPRWHPSLLTASAFSLSSRPGGGRRTPFLPIGRGTTPMMAGGGGASTATDGGRKDDDNDNDDITGLEDAYNFASATDGGNRGYYQKQQQQPERPVPPSRSGIGGIGGIGDGDENKDDTTIKAGPPPSPSGGTGKKSGTPTTPTIKAGTTRPTTPSMSYASLSAFGKAPTTRSPTAKVPPSPPASPPPPTPASSPPPPATSTISTASTATTSSSRSSSDPAVWNQTPKTKTPTTKRPTSSSSSSSSSSSYGSWASLGAKKKKAADATNAAGTVASSSSSSSSSFPPPLVAPPSDSPPAPAAATTTKIGVLDQAMATPASSYSTLTSSSSSSSAASAAAKRKDAAATTSSAAAAAAASATSAAPPKMEDTARRGQDGDGGGTIGSAAKVAQVADVPPSGEHAEAVVPVQGATTAEPAGGAAVDASAVSTVPDGGGAATVGPEGGAATTEDAPVPSLEPTEVVGPVDASDPIRPTPEASLSVPRHTGTEPPEKTALKDGGTALIKPEMPPPMSSEPVSAVKVPPTATPEVASPDEVQIRQVALDAKAVPPPETPPATSVEPGTDDSPFPPPSKPQPSFYELLSRQQRDERKQRPKLDRNGYTYTSYNEAKDPITATVNTPPRKLQVFEQQVPAETKNAQVDDPSPPRLKRFERLEEQEVLEGRPHKEQEELGGGTALTNLGLPPPMSAEPVSAMEVSPTAPPEVGSDEMPPTPPPLGPDEVQILQAALDAKEKSESIPPPEMPSIVSVEPEKDETVATMMTKEDRTLSPPSKPQPSFYQLLSRQQRDELRPKMDRNGYTYTSYNEAKDPITATVNTPPRKLQVFEQQVEAESKNSLLGALLSEDDSPRQVDGPPPPRLKRFERLEELEALEGRTRKEEEAAPRLQFFERLQELELLEGRTREEKEASPRLQFFERSAGSVEPEGDDPPAPRLNFFERLADEDESLADDVAGRVADAVGGAVAEPLPTHLEPDEGTVVGASVSEPLQTDLEPDEVTVDFASADWPGGGRDVPGEDFFMLDSLVEEALLRDRPTPEDGTLEAADYAPNAGVVGATGPAGFSSRNSMGKAEAVAAAALNGGAFNSAQPLFIDAPFQIQPKNNPATFVVSRSEETRVIRGPSPRKPRLPIQVEGDLDGAPASDAALRFYKRTH